MYGISGVSTSSSCARSKTVASRSRSEVNMPRNSTEHGVLGDDYGQVAEWSIARRWKRRELVRVPGVQISPCPPIWGISMSDDPKWANNPEHDHLYELSVNLTEWLQTEFDTRDLR